MQNQEADSDLGTSLDSAIDTSSIVDNNQPVSSWSPEDCFGNEVGPEPQDFGNVLSQLGIGVPSNFWEMDRTTFTDLPEIDPSFVNISRDPTNIPQLLENGALNGQTPFSDYTSPSFRSTGSLTNGKISSIEALTRRVGNSDSLHSSEPPAIYIRKNETAGHYVGELAMKIRQARANSFTRLSRLEFDRSYAGDMPYRRSQEPAPPSQAQRP